MDRISAVLFDFGKVLSGPPSAAVWLDMQRVSGLSAAELDRAYWLPRDDYDRGTLDSQGYWSAVASEAHANFDLSARDRLIELDVELWTEMNEPMVDWVRALHRAGVRTGILSNIGDAMAAGICAKFDWIGGFHHAVWSHALRLRKPEAEIYAAAIAGLGVPAGQILFIDDRDENIAAALRSGMQAILYSTHAAFEREMVSRGLAHLLHPAHAAFQAAS